jgi:hypothetical protein
MKTALRAVSEALRKLLPGLDCSKTANFIKETPKTAQNPFQAKPMPEPSHLPVQRAQKPSTRQWRSTVSWNFVPGFSC